MTSDATLLPAVVEIMTEAGSRLLDAFSDQARPSDLDSIWSALAANDALTLRHTRAALLQLRPGSEWVEDEAGSGSLPSGEWWVADPAEGNINHVHGLGDWATTVTLVRDNVPVLAVAHEPLRAITYTAVRGHGAYEGNQRLRVSAKTNLGAAIVATGQAMPGEGPQTYRRIGESVTAMLEHSFLVRAAVPATLQLTHVAAGRFDAFWQYSAVRSGLLPGALLVTESGGTVTDIQGRPWTLASENFLATTPDLHDAAVRALAPIA